MVYIFNLTDTEVLLANQEAYIAVNSLSSGK